MANDGKAAPGEIGWTGLTVRDASALSTPYRKYSRVFRTDRSLTVADPIRAARVSKRFSDTSLGRYCVFQDPAGAFAALYESQPALNAPRRW